MKKPINVLSLFDGMACLYIALKELDIPVGNYYASEKDKFAIKQSTANFPNIIHLGDVRKIDVSKLPKIHIIGGGSPCTDLSFAGKQTGLICNTLAQYLELRSEYIRTGDENLYFHNGKFQESVLFWEYLRILKELQQLNPDVIFLLENVRMSKANERIINEALGLHPVAINSNLVSAQNRYRIYWSNIRTRAEGLFSDLFTHIPQPADKCILLKDILQPESEIDEKYYMSTDTIKGLMNNNRFNPHENADKTGYSITTHPMRSSSNFIKVDKKGNKKAAQDKAGCLTAGGHSGGNHSDMDILCVSMVGRKINENGKRDDYNHNLKAAQRLESAPDNKTNCLTSVSKDNLILEKNSSGNRFFSHNNKHQSLVENGRSNTGVVLEDYRLRRLTSTECARLQTIPSWYKWVVSDTQAYKMLGNGWTVEIIKYILSYLK